MKSIFLFVFLYLFTYKSIAQSFLKDKFRVIEIFYINPDQEFFSGTKIHEVLCIDKKESGLGGSAGSQFYYCKLKPGDVTDSIFKLFRNLQVCRTLELEDRVYNNIRVVMKIKYCFLKKPEYILITGIDNQNIIWGKNLYSSNSNFYRYVMSIWSCHLIFKKQFEDGLCDVF